MDHLLKFKPILKSKIWGGDRLSAIYSSSEADSKHLPVGESYLLSGLTCDESIVLNGEFAGQSLSQLIERFKGELIGESSYEKHQLEFPLLIKAIDAAQDLSVQVHPNDELAQQYQHANGKTELWYIVDAENDATLISGFSQKTSKQEFKQYYQDGRLMDLLNVKPTQKDDIFFIQAGKVHTIGKGNLIIEVQQSSDLTYRIFDFDRRDDEGNLRELHHDLAYEAMDYDDTDSGRVLNRNNELSKEPIIACDYFTMNMLNVYQTMECNYAELDSFVVLINVGDDARLQSKSDSCSVNFLEAILVPAKCQGITIEPESDNCKFLEVFIEN
ncbi:MAG: type I phosphomannose isomerase catalytic subunit [Paraglaciecola sp.]|uniref:type I phosphomannose isomerase catalytic subunit n=1 Tax=Paraglaciecola sp. TaxID=1920173 RepID=UPI0032665B7E